jgi:hypothetical protein
MLCYLVVVALRLNQAHSSTFHAVVPLEIYDKVGIAQQHRLGVDFKLLHHYQGCHIKVVVDASMLSINCHLQVSCTR